MYSALRRLLFLLEAEQGHDLVMTTLALASRSKSMSSLCGLLGGGKPPSCPVEVMGIPFPNPVGLAAGLDKHARAANALGAMGFGWVELGTVTPRPQPGNPRPRMFRIPEHEAIINRMGFNSVGLEMFLKHCKGTAPHLLKGINIGKNAATPLSGAVDDYLTCLEAVYPYADYIAINISSPNTPGLRGLHQDEALNLLLSRLNHQRRELADFHGTRVPLVLKIAPDIGTGEVDAIASLLRQHQMDGVAATNTTVSRNQIESHFLSGEPGGLSGPPLREKSTAVVAALYQNLQDEIPIIGIGGINTAADAMEKFDAGAKLVQLYTGFVYHGPGLIRDICRDLSFGKNP